MLIVALDYKDTTVTASSKAHEGPLDCVTDAKQVEALARACEHDVTCLYNGQCTKANVISAISQVGQRCKNNDFFVFYFCGHGAQVQDNNGDEADGLDEAFVLVNHNGVVTDETLMIDDDFSDAIYSSVVDPRTRVLILNDCGLDVADLNGKKWTGRKAVSISGFSEGGLKAPVGLFTQAMLQAVDKIGQFGIYHTRDKSGYLGLDKLYSVGMLYNAALMEDAAIFGTSQEVTIQCTQGASADRMPWPLMPPKGYESPLRHQALGSPKYESDEAPPEEKVGRDCTGQAIFKGCSPCKSQGLPQEEKPESKVSPTVLAAANIKNVFLPVNESYVDMVQGTDMLSEVSRSCHSDKCAIM